MKDLGRQPTPVSNKESKRDTGVRVRYVGTYEPIDRVDVEAVEPEDIVPSQEPRDTDVWFTEWQVAEDSLDVALDQHVDWSLVPMDQNWVSRLFAGRRTIPLQLDTYADAVRDPSDRTDRTQLSGRVARIDQISVRYHPSKDPEERGVLVPETGGATQHSVLSFRQSRGHHGKVVGWIVRLRE